MDPQDKTPIHNPAATAAGRVPHSPHGEGDKLTSPPFCPPPCIALAPLSHSNPSGAVGGSSGHRLLMLPHDPV